MFLATDVHYNDNVGYAAGVLFDDWSSAVATRPYTAVCLDVGDYEPGAFYRRELPCLLTLLDTVEGPLSTIIVDGHVYLDGADRPGLGSHLHSAIKQSVEVVGVAKNPFKDMPDRHQVLRGTSQKPLFVTTTGDLASALSGVASMTGEHRMPDLLKLADQACRALAKQEA